jgi:ribosomal protein S18 acetylase RimI-like enzyme
MLATVSSSVVRLVPADSIELDALVGLFNEAYSDYAVPLQLDRASLEFTADVCDIDLGASRVALEDGEPAAFAYLALRGAEGWIGGMGTVPGRRRRGLGEAALRAVLSEAAARGAGSVRLEVIQENHAARGLYAKLGFEHARDLGVWTLESAPSRLAAANPAAFEDAHAWIEANRRAREPWQRADETVEHMRARGLELEALTVEENGGTVGALLYQHRGGPPGALQLAARDEQAAARLLAALAALGGGLRFVNVPTDDPAAAALTLLRARTDIWQHELRVSL